MIFKVILAPGSLVPVSLAHPCHVHLGFLQMFFFSLHTALILMLDLTLAVSSNLLNTALVCVAYLQESVIREEFNALSHPCL